MQNVENNDLKDAVFDILKEHVKNVVCIDDEFIGFYGTGKANNYEDMLYKTFSDITKGFVNMVKFDGDIEKCVTFTEKADLIILDWEIEKSGAGDKFEKTLQILERIVNKSCSLICVYTQELDMDNIYNIITSSFLGIKWEEIKKWKDKFKDFKLNDFEADIEKEFITGEPFPTIKIAEWKKDNRVYYDLLVKEGFDKFDKIVKLLKYYYLHDRYDRVYQNELKDIKLVPMYRDNQLVAININGKIITVFNKNQPDSKETNISISPENVFEAFSNMVYMSPNNIFNVMWMYYKDGLKNQLKNSSSFLNNISDSMLLYLKQQIEADKGQDEGVFENELKDHFKEDIVSQINSLDFSIDSKIMAYISNCGVIKPTKNEFFQFNSYYSQNHSLSKKERKIIFGDMFYAKELLNKFEEDSKGYDDIKNKILLCITAHCDCLHTNENSKIRGNFHFAIGEILRTTTPLLKPETDIYGLYDFIDFDGESIAVKWDSYFTKLYLKGDGNFINSDGNVQGYYKDCKIEFKYIGNLKEGYTQRIANKLFSFSNRVGITYLGDKEMTATAKCENCQNTFSQK